MATGAFARRFILSYAKGWPARFSNIQFTRFQTRRCGLSRWRPTWFRSLAVRFVSSERRTSPTLRRAMVLAGHLAFGVVALSYTVKDIAWLRGLSIGASILSIGYSYYVPSSPLWLVIGWNIVFMVVNAGHLVLIAKKRKGVTLTDDEMVVYNSVFGGTESGLMNTREFAKFVRHNAEWCSFPAGQRLITEGEQPSHVYIIVRGRVSVEIGGHFIGEVGEGHFMGDIAFLRNSASPVTVTAIDPNGTYCIAFDRKRIDELAKSESRLHAAFLSVVSKNLVRDVEEYWFAEVRKER